MGDSEFSRDRDQTIYLSERSKRAQGKTMTYAVLVALLFVVGCSGSPTAPTPTTPPITVTPPVTTPPVTSTPPVVTTPPPAIFPPNDPRFDLAFYRQFAHNALETRTGALEPLRRQRDAPRIYLRTVDDGGMAIDTMTLNQTAAALEQTAGALTGVFGVASIERGSDTRRGQPGWITVEWIRIPPAPNVCGSAQIGGDAVQLFHRASCTRCPGGPAVSLSVVKHELGHALGFYHTNQRDDLMFPQYRQCDLDPSDRERYHASVAYTRPIGSPAP